MTNKKLRHKARRVLLRAKLPYHIAVYAANKSVEHDIDCGIKLALERYGYDCMWDHSEIFNSTLVAFKQYKNTSFAEYITINVTGEDAPSISIKSSAIQIPNGDYDRFIKNQRIMYSEI